MDSSSTSLEDQRGRQCNVCYQAFSREGEHIPRILSCGHTYCTACLGKLVGKFCMGKICCPTCKADTSIPGMVNNVQKLAKNFAVLDILDGLEEAIRGNSLATNQMLLCNEHDNEPKKVYCLTDRVVICIYCQVYGAHKGHECQLVSHVASTNREILAQLEQDLTVQKQTLLPSWRNLQEISNAVQLKEEKLLREMRRHFDILRRKLCRREKEVAGHLKSLTSGKVLVLRKQCRSHLLPDGRYLLEVGETSTLSIWDLDAASPRTKTEPLPATPWPSAQTQSSASLAAVTETSLFHEE